MGGRYNHGAMPLTDRLSAPDDKPAQNNTGSKTETPLLIGTSASGQALRMCGAVGWPLTDQSPIVVPDLLGQMAVAACDYRAQHFGRDAARTVTMRR